MGGPANAPVAVPHPPVFEARTGDAGSGAQELATYFVGQIVGSMDAVRPARQVMLDLVTDYADAAERFVGYLGD